MKIAGFQKQSLIDYPGNISSVIFTQGCNFRCCYCHNPELVLPSRFGDTCSEETLLNYFERYKHLLDAVCITGGEPTMHAGLIDFIKKVRVLGLLVKLDTNGTNSGMLKRLIDEKLIDFVAMDIKHHLNLDSYRKVVGARLSEVAFDQVLHSVNIIKDSGIPHQFRSTVVGGLHTETDVTVLNNQFNGKLKIQQYREGDVLDPSVEMFTLEEENSIATP
ncbi:anaerobic ribonucleoside-triphosphate reductase activating protein [Puteibacter caeruleilacunae]|nr:anaerobic ribonucleoside-triphosphate reductase activating protein [Puteibacter caeruleilacunae]